MAYKSSYTGPQIDQAVSHAVNMDVNPTAGHTDRVVSSGGVKSALNTVDESIAIRVSGNKTTYASGAAIGQYVIVSGSTITGITDGIYKAAKAIPYNTGIDSTYLAAVSGGGMNDLKAAMCIQNSGTYYVANTPSDYPLGITIESSYSSGFPAYGLVVTIRNRTDRGCQIAIPYQSSGQMKMSIRSEADSSSWTAWTTFTGS